MNETIEGLMCALLLIIGCACFWGAAYMFNKRSPSFLSPKHTLSVGVDAAHSVTIVEFAINGTLILPAHGSTPVIKITKGSVEPVIIQPWISDSISCNGVLHPKGVSIVLSGGAGSYVTLKWEKDRWVTRGYVGTLSKGDAQ
jgi:hypothetical protein